MRKLVQFDCYLCDGCRTYVYNELLGDHSLGVPAETLVDELPASWTCPICGAHKDQLRPSTMIDGFVPSNI